MDKKENSKKSISDYIGMGTMIGFCAALGTLVGVILGNFIFWLIGSAAVGVVIGAIVEVQRKRSKQ